jgi:hypothetical protein
MLLKGSRMLCKAFLAFRGVISLPKEKALKSAFKTILELFSFLH